MQLTYDFFENKNFRIPSESSRGKVNIAVLESVGYLFSQKDNDFLHKNQEIIKSNFFENLLNNQEYLDAVQISTGDRKRVIKRFQLAQEILGDVTHAHAD